MVKDKLNTRSLYKIQRCLFVTKKQTSIVTIILYSISLFCTLLIAYACTFSEKQQQASISTTIDIPAQTPAKKSQVAIYMDSLGLIDITKLDESIVVQLMYTQADNFVGEILYDSLTEAYLHPDAAYALIRAQRILKDWYPSYSLIVYDAARPMSVQQKMWDKVKGTSKYNYVSNPRNGGGLHNYGLAVDISIIDSLGQPLPMGTPVDYLGSKAHISYEDELVRDGFITEAERQNRILLRTVMKEAGFQPLPSEWWHFNFCDRETARRKYQLIND